MRIPIDKIVENECLRVASIFGVDELNNRTLLIDTQHQDKFGEEYDCLGRTIKVEYKQIDGKPAKLIRKEA